MIHSNELRVGNKVYFNGEIDTVWAVYENNKVNTNDDNMSSEMGCELISPIPITPEILEKCGFIKSEIENGNPLEGYYYSMELKEDKFCDLSLIEGDKNGVVEVCLFPYGNNFRYKYLHQLQNLYFALTGEELQVNLT